MMYSLGRLLILISGSGRLSVEAFSAVSSSSSSRCIINNFLQHHVRHQSLTNHHRRLQSYYHSNSVQQLKSTSAEDKETLDATELEASQTRETPRLTSDDKALVSSMYNSCSGNTDAIENAITANLDTMHPRLVVALQLAGKKKEWNEDDKEVDGDAGSSDDEEFAKQMVAVGTCLQNVLDVQLRSGREMLAELLNSGEIRKMDSTIGKAAKDGRLDMSFFTVLNMNMKDAAMNDIDGSTDTSPTLATGEGQPEVSAEESKPIEGANRYQILQHIYTRCQEELEKNVPPGIGLLNKLLRTDISSIRSNQLSHYLGPQKTTITSPDGKTIDLGGTGKPLVSHSEFINALSNAVTQIRTLESAGGTDRLSATNLVENIRQVAMEARVVLVESYGEGSDVVTEFSRDLQPVFRPGSK